MLHTHLCVDISNKLNENKLQSPDHETLGIEEGTSRDIWISLEGEVDYDNGRNRCERREKGLRKEMMANTVRTEDILLAERVLWKLPNNSDCWQDNSLLSTN